MTFRAEKGHLANGGPLSGLKTAPGTMKKVAERRRAQEMLDKIGTLAAPLDWKPAKPKR
jgi:hypothetical protein